MLARLIEAADDLALAVRRADLRPAPARILRAARRAAAAVDAARQARALRRARRRPGLHRPLRRASRRPRAGSVHRRRPGAPARARWVLVGEDFRFGKGARGRSLDAAWRRANLQRRGDAHGRRRRRARVVDDGPRRAGRRRLRARRRAARPTLHDRRPRRARRQARPHARLSDRQPAPARNGRRSPACSRCACTGSAPRRAPASRASACARPSPTGARRCSRCSCSTSTRRSTAGASSVEFLHKLRDEARFPDLDALTRQMHRDVAEARDFFAAGR